MIDIITYRSRIGIFSPKSKNKKFLYKRKYYEEFNWNKNLSGKKTLFLLQSVRKLVMLLWEYQDKIISMVMVLLQVESMKCFGILCYPLF